MKTIRTLLVAASAMLLLNVAQAQSAPAMPATPATPASSATVPTGANTPYSADPLVQKREADGQAKKEYKARKKAAKKTMKAEKKAAKADMKEDKAEAKDIRNNAMAAEPAAK